MRMWLGRKVRLGGVLAALALLFLMTAAPGGGGSGGAGGGFRGAGGGFAGGGRGSSPGATERPPEWLAWILAALPPTAVVAILFGFNQFRIVHVVVDLRHGERYVPALDELLCKSDFSLPATRVQTLAALGRLLDPEDVVDGWVAVSGTAGSVKHLDERAE